VGIFFAGIQRVQGEILKEFIYRRLMKLLTAIMKSGEKICLGDGWERQSLQLLRKQDLFYCPYCHEKVILKLGEKRIFHFSHLSNNHCEYEQGGESEYHCNGKIQLYQWLKKQNVNPILEYYNPLIKQRADIVFTDGNKQYAMEYQCSTINEATLRKRTNGYHSIGYDPIWILGANQLDRKTSKVTSFTDFHYLFLRESANHNWILPFYCSIANKFILHDSIKPITVRHAISNQRIINLDKMDLTHLFTSPEYMIVRAETWIKELNRWKTKLIRYPGAYQNPFLIALYQNNLNLLTLPPYLGFPIEKSSCIATPPFIWQTYLLIDVLLKKSPRCPILIQEMNQAFQKRIYMKHIETRALPFIEQALPTDAVYQFCLFLVQLGALKMINDQTFELVRPLFIPSTIQEQKEMELTFIRYWTQVIIRE
jgi:competence protein CoiA